MTIWFIIGYLAVGFPIRKSPDQCSFAAPRSLSQLITSFIGSWCQGIPLALFLAWPIKHSLYKFLLLRKVQFWFSITVELCRLILEVYFSWNCGVTQFWLNKFPFMLPSHNCIIITMFSFQGAFFESLLQETQWNILLKVFQSISCWWRVPGSNRWPPACKAGALPAELTPHRGSLWSGGPKWTRTIDLTIISRVL